jgi:hypothetical protein
MARGLEFFKVAAYPPTRGHGVWEEVSIAIEGIYI